MTMIYSSGNSVEPEHGENTEMEIGKTNNHPLLADLTEPQREAVVTTEGAVLVVAAAGSGKTRVITRRVAWLVKEAGIAPWQVLAITFTNKAAGEMRQRVSEMLSYRQANALMVCTFHSLCARLLREYATQGGLSGDYSIYDTADQRNAVKQAMKELNVNTKNFPPNAVLSMISNAKNELIDVDGFAAGADDFYRRTVARVYTVYEKILKQNNALDFDDLLMKFADLLRHDENARTELQERFAYLLIDEYQDTNHAQYIISHLLSVGHGNICVVGDPDQSIYGWRGANIQNILDFEKHHPDATVIELGQNYRSTPQILAAADALISVNTVRRHKPLFTENSDGEKVEVVYARDEEHEAEIVINRMRDMQSKGLYEWQDMAVFYRINALSRVVEDSLLRANIPYQVARGTAFYQRKEVKDLIAYLKVLSNSADEISLLRIINTPTRGIGKSSIQRMQAWAGGKGITLYGSMERVNEIDGLTVRAVNSVKRFVSMYGKWRDNMAGGGDTINYTARMRDVMEMVLRDSGIEDYYKNDKTGDEEKLANAYELVTAAQRFDDEYGEDEAALSQRLRDYLESVSLVADVDVVDNDGGAVTLMTLHAAKGLEFGFVAIIGLEDRLLPHSRAFDDPGEMEEERRLCFVGITRAEERVMLTNARYRTIRGIRERTVPSQFLSELEPEVVSVTDVSCADENGFDDDWRNSGRSRGGWGGGKRAGVNWQRRTKSINSDNEASSAKRDDFDGDDFGAYGGSGSKRKGSENWPTGCLVRHPQFGLGKVISVSGAGVNSRVKVRFDRAGVKTLVLEYARLERVE